MAQKTIPRTRSTGAKLAGVVAFLVTAVLIVFVAAEPVGDWMCRHWRADWACPGQGQPHPAVPAKQGVRR